MDLCPQFVVIETEKKAAVRQAGSNNSEKNAQRRLFCGVDARMRGRSQGGSRNGANESVQLGS
jgi:hypothetical protein